MLKWCKNAVYKNQSETRPVIAQCQKSPLKGHSYRALDFSFREEVNAVAIASFPQQKIEQTSLGTNRQICHLYLDDPQAIASMQEVKQESRQYQAWIKNIKTVLQNIQKPEIQKISDYENEWKDSIESILKKLSIEDADLLEGGERTAKEVQSLEELLEKTQKDKVEISNAIDSYQPLEASVEYIRRTSKESGYFSEESIYSSTETIVLEESGTVFMQANKQITKKNELYKNWMSSLEEKLKSNVTLNFIKTYKTSNLKMLEDLKSPSFKNVELKQKNRKNEEAIQFLKVQIIENIEINAAYQDLLSEEIYFYKLDKLEKRLSNEQKESKEIDNHLKESAQLHANIELFTECLIQTKKLISLLKSE